MKPAKMLSEATRLAPELAEPASAFAPGALRSRRPSTSPDCISETTANTSPPLASPAELLAATAYRRFFRRPSPNDSVESGSCHNCGMGRHAPPRKPPSLVDNEPGLSCR